MIAVISADLLESSGYSSQLLERVLNTLNSEFGYLEKADIQSNFEIYRGDSLQGILPPIHALKTAILFKTAINKLHSRIGKNTNSFKKEADLRVSIGIGTFDFKRTSILESNGQAFQFSGRALDDLKEEGRKIKLVTPIENINAEFEASLFLFEIISDKWSTASAEVVYYLLKGLKETEIADEIGISQSAVNQRKKAAGWDAIELLLARFAQVITENFTNGK
ncbi:hypothetical protein [Christiangramia aquimixticola]|uniref:hypothetical protein n=1 Tax=Christiangramia aquimixticola TaxID=1697558 RepID=UPI003AA8D07E